jgi:eukaryotic-like serine/threonine-protein kinase
MLAIVPQNMAGSAQIMADNDTLNLVGKTIADKYLVEAVVGEGGFAVVYRAMHLVWKRPAALKVFKALGEMPADRREQLMQDFVQEGALLAELSERSAAICQARDIGMLSTEKGEQLPYMVLEWLEGQSLEEALLQEEHQRMPVRSLPEAMKLVEPAAEALALAHTKGIAHRDVKPANIFVLGDARNPQTTVKLLDFGIAKVVQNAQQMAGTFKKTTGHVTSFTPAYGAPEQFSRKIGATGPWTDVYALALLLVEMISGKPALDGEDYLQLAYCSSNDQSRPTPRERGVQLPNQIEAVFERALAVSPDNRYQTAGDFWNALCEAQQMAPMRSLVSTGNPTDGGGRGVKVITDPTISPKSELGDTAVAPQEVAALAQTANHTTANTANLASTTHPEASGSKKPLIFGGIALILAVGGLGIFLATRTPPKPESTPVAAISNSSPPQAVTSSSAHVLKPCPSGMIAIKGGQFFMGSGNPKDEENEHPQHPVILSPFCMDIFEVTTEDYLKCSTNGKCARASNTNINAGISEGARPVYDTVCSMNNLVKRAKFPINCVTWEMANGYCAEQKKRLPSEAEWEFAARGQDGRRYPWGDEPPSTKRMNACGQECVLWGIKNHTPLKSMYPENDGFENLAPVGSFPAGKSLYGVQDTMGNVSEWVNDWYAPYTKTAKPVLDPQGPKTGTERVIRGGAWNGSDDAWLRPTHRFKKTPDAQSHGIGFRCAMAR